MCYKEKLALEKIRNIERISYPRFMWEYQDSENFQDLYHIINKNNDKGKFFYHIDKNWYVLGVIKLNETIISDLASTGVFNFKQMNHILDILKEHGNKKITADCRDSTSYSLLKLLEQRGTIEILNENAWLWGNEKMYKLSFYIKPKTFCEWLDFNS